MTTNATPRFFGPLAVILALALPAGLMSALSPTSTGELVDAADDIIIARVESLLQLEEPDRTVLKLEVERNVLGAIAPGDLVRTLEGRTRLRAGDTAVFLFSEDSDGILGHLHLVKSGLGRGYEIVTPVTGMASQGLPHHGPALPVADFVSAVLLRRGLAGASGGAPQYAIGPPSVTGIPADAFEPNDTQGTASPLSLGALGDTTSVTGLTLTRDDVDFFAFTEPLPLIKVVAETMAPPPGTATTDTYLGLFDGGGNLIGADDDGANSGRFSKLEVPVIGGGDFAVAVAPFADTDFDGSGGNVDAPGPYDLAVQRLLGNYIWNGVDFVAGFSADGSLGDDGVGYRPVGGADTIAFESFDGWGLEYFVDRMPSGVTAIAFGGGGEFWIDPGFTNTLVNQDFEFAGVVDSNGNNRRGFGRSATVVAHEISPIKGVGVDHEYTWSLGSDTLKGEITIRVPLLQNIDDVVYERVIDVNLFGETDNEFHWSFDDDADVQCFAVDTATTVGGIPLPVDEVAGPVAGNQQFALRIDHGTGGLEVDGRFGFTRYPAAFTMVLGFGSAADAKAAAQKTLERCGMSTWVIAVEQDPDTGDFGAFGVGLGEP